MPVQEMLARLSSRELAEWRAYYRIKAEKREQERMVNEAVSGAQQKRWR